MAETRAAWGIDIGQSAFKALKLRYQEDGEQVVAVAFDYIPYPKILSQPDAIPDEIVRQAMETFLSRNEVEGDLIAISVPGQSALARFIQLPPIESSKLSEIIKYEARQQIPFALEDVIWDYQPLGGGAEESGYLLDAEVGLFAMKRDQVLQQLKPFNEAKLEVELIQIAPLTLYNVLTYDELGMRPDVESDSLEEYVIVLDMGCDNTALLVSNGKKIWVRNVPLGGNHFTRALTKEMKLSFAKAEHLKCNATKSPDPRAVFQALRPVFNDYASEIQRSIGFFSSVNRQAKVSKVIGVGNGFKLAGLQKFLQQNLQYQVDRPDTFKALAGDAVVNAPLFADNILSFAVPYGLALQVLGRTRIRTSLLPPEIATARKIRRKKPWAVAAAAVLLMGYTVSTMVNANSYAKPHSGAFHVAEESAHKLTEEVAAEQAAYSAEQAKFEATRQQLDDLVMGRRDLTWLDAYNAVLDCLPRDEENQQDVNDIEKREMISITSYTAQRMADVGMWYQGLMSDQKFYMTADDKATPPAGPGYVITLRGQHWHDDTDSLNTGLAYVRSRLLNNLQKWQVEVPNFPPRDVRRMGIGYPTLVEKQESMVPYDPLGVTKRTVRQAAHPTLGGVFGGGLGGNVPFNQPPSPPSTLLRPAAPRPPGTRPPDQDEVRYIKQLDFALQFVFQPIAEKDRTTEADAPPRGAAAEAPVEGAAALDVPP